MNTFVALLRGINVGGKNRLPMKELVSVLEGLGLEKVKTYIQSGNVVFRSRSNNKQELEMDIGAALKKSHDLTPEVLVLSVGELREAMAGNPYPEAEHDPKSVHLFFLKSPPNNPDLQKLESLQAESERFQLVDAVFYLHTPGGIGRSRLGAKVEKNLGVAATARNWRSVSRIISLADCAP
jgi:uncharacterized protein (DUF1697 family)